MKTFFKKLGVFLVISIVAIILIASIPRFLIKKNSKFKLKKNETTVVFGHSHPECAFNDSLIANFKNLAESGESYFYNYQKIKKVIPDNPKIETVILEFSNDQITKEMDEWIWGYDKMNYYLPKYSAFMDKVDYLILFNNNLTDLIACTSVSFKKNLFRVLKSDYYYTDEIGGFKWLDKNQLETNNNQNNLDQINISTVNLEYLRKIIEYCRNQNVTVYLARSPQHKDLVSLKNEYLFQKIRSEQFSDVEFLDFNTFPVPNEYFADFGHLNHKGAEIFSKFISRLFKMVYLSLKTRIK